MKHCFLYIFLIFGAFSICHAQELRLEVGADYTIKRFNLAVEVQLRMPSLIENDFLGLIEAEVVYKITKRLHLELGYRFKTNVAEFYPESHIDYNNKHRLAFDLGYSLRRFDNGIKLGNTIRYQMNLSESGKHNHYFRNEFELNYKISKLLKPYIAPSIYYNINKQEFSKFRIELGNKFEFDKNNIGVYYIIEADISRTEKTRYVIGVQYGIRFW